MIESILSLIQEHTRVIYNLDNKAFELKRVPARELLSPHRFDLFAKLFYIHYRNTDQELAQKVYREHIKVFNPDLREPGRDDKTSIDDFQRVFDKILLDFSTNEFDDSISIVPVDKNGIILDGAHRVSALSFYDKKVTIAQFKDVESKGEFDYKYFLNRGISMDVADCIALEAVNWCENLYAACVWPRVFKSTDRSFIKNYIQRNNVVLYDRPLLVSLTSLSCFVANIYSNQSWVGTKENNYKGAFDKAMNCYSSHKRFNIMFFQSSLPLSDILRMKDDIRKHFNYGKHTIHITDNETETKEIAKFVLDRKYRALWMQPNNKISLNFIFDKSNELFHLFKHNCWIPFKVFIYRLLHF